MSAETDGELAAHHEQEIVWTGCLKMPGECARIDVPADHAEPDGAVVDLSLHRIAARGEPRGTLPYNPGRPGVSEMASDSSYVRGLSDEIRDDFDVVGFDPRGIADSEGLDRARERIAVAFGCAT